ncbi:MAG: hypothetical protein H0U95_10600 [Bacteroidetes bacterium]|nr:hypothetical protein [Bacteroidota bacterium]
MDRSDLNSFSFIIAFIVLIFPFGLLTNCSMFDQNDFISTEKVGQIDNETFLYSAYKTGIDNYRIEFKVVVDKDTSKIFDYYINDGIYTKERSFDFSIVHDTLIVSCHYQLCKKYHKTKKGTTIEVTKNSDTKRCLN